LGWKLTPQEMLDTRDLLNHLYNISGGNPIRGTIMDIKNALFNDAEQSGMEGLNEARAMQAETKSMDKLVNRYSKPTTLRITINGLPSKKLNLMP